MSIDPKSGGKVSPNDSQRIGRLLEMYYTDGRVPSRMMQENGAKPFPFKIVKIAIVRSDRNSQIAVIEQRFHENAGSRIRAGGGKIIYIRAI